jgi:hypothetical protein
MNAIRAYIESNEDCTQAAMRATLSCAFDVLPMTEVVGVDALSSPLFDPNAFYWFQLQAISAVHSLLVRGIHSGLVSICGCLIQALHVPIIPLEPLCDFFKSDQVSVFKRAPRIIQAGHGHSGRARPGGFCRGGSAAGRHLVICLHRRL